MSRYLLEARNVSFSYGARSILDGVDLTLAEGEIVALLGANGGGKSTLLRILSGLLAPAAGADIRLHGKALVDLSRKAVARQVATLGQDVPRAFGFSVQDLVALGRFPHLKPWQRLRPIDRQAIEAAIEATALGDLRTRLMENLSGGERQRVGLAIALAQEPQVLLLDEPTAHLDLKHKSLLFSVLRQAQAKRKMGTILVTHDLGLAAEHASRVILLAAGRVLASGPPHEVLSRQSLEETFGTQVELIVNPRTGVPHAFAGGGLVDDSRDS